MEAKSEDGYSYQALARRWRPRSFEEMVGQSVAVDTLRKMLDSGKLHHAFLFTGTRGVGKTTLARLLAKAICCERGVSANPCGVCEHCVAIDKGCYPDLLEIDAASNTRVEDMRDLLSQVQFVPLVGSYKIYLIDEVHMLSAHSFNALLKTLEEPPEHVKFLFATTDPQKLPITILSRVLQFHLRALSDEQIAGQLGKIMASRGLRYEPSALSMIGKAGKGSMRDALTILEQALAYAGQDELSCAMVDKLLGTVSSETFFELLEGLLCSDGAKVCSLLAKIAALGLDLQELLDELLLALQQLSMFQLIPDYKIHLSSDDKINVALAGLINLKTPEQLQLYYQILLLGKRDLVWAANPLSGLEMLMLRCLAFTIDDSPKRDRQAVKRTVETQDSILANVPLEKEAISDNLESSTIPSGGNGSNLPVTKEEWQNVLANLNCDGLVHTLLQYCVFDSFQGGVVRLLVDQAQKALISPSCTKRLTEALSLALGREVAVQIEVGSGSLDTPMAKLDSARRAKMLKARETFAQDQTVQLLQEELAASFDPAKVKLKDD